MELKSRRNYANLQIALLCAFLNDFPVPRTLNQLRVPKCIGGEEYHVCL